MEILFFLFLVLPLWCLVKIVQAVSSNHRESYSTPGVTPNERLKVRVGRIIDGDSVEVSNSGETFEVRLSAIDCPESDQEWGNEATAGLRKLIENRRYVYLEIRELDCHERTVATVYREEDGLNVNEQMVMLGHAWVYRQYYNHLSKARQDKLDQLEGKAKAKQVGLWKSEGIVAPWDWRKRKEFLSTYLIVINKKTGNPFLVFDDSLINPDGRQINYDQSLYRNVSDKDSVKITPAQERRYNDLEAETILAKISHGAVPSPSTPREIIHLILWRNQNLPYNPYWTPRNDQFLKDISRRRSLDNSTKKQRAYLQSLFLDAVENGYLNKKAD